MHNDEGLELLDNNKTVEILPLHALQCLRVGLAMCDAYALMNIK